MIKFYRVGGAVRDRLLGVKSKDIDFSVEAPSYDAMRQEIIGRGGTIFLETPEYFTIRAKMPEFGDADFVLCRKDGEYSDKRRPDIVEIGTIYDDLARRDFTMNAIAVDEQGNYIDPHNGIDDIKYRIIRCVGQPIDRFSEDYLRILRAARFNITKNMLLDEEIIPFFRYPWIKRIIENCAEDRIRDELTKMFRHNTYNTLGLFHDFPDFLNLFNHCNIWLKPTSEKR